MKSWRAISLGMILLFQTTSRSEVLARDGPPEIEQRNYVVLLHGLGRTRWSMKGLERALAAEGYRVINVSYPSTRFCIEDVAGHCLGDLLQQRASDPTAKIHFVTHSLGGIVLRQYLHEHKLENLGRVVMLAPPNQGSELADRFHHSIVHRFLTGPAGLELGTGPCSLPNRLGRAAFEVGIIAGDRSVNPWFSTWIPGPDDGKVSVRRARLEGMKDFLVVHHSHTWMMWRRDVVGQVARFLRRGSFEQKPY